MPNWCNNSILIKGDATKIRALWDAFQNKDCGLLNAMVPMPVQLRNTFKGTGDEAQTEEFDGYTNWYDWSIARWGTKWDVDTDGLYFQELENGQMAIAGCFDSAWGPPVEAFQAYSNANPDVEMELKYFEPGMGFIGVWDNEGGDAYWENVEGLLDVTADEDPVIYDLLDTFQVWQCYNMDDEEQEEEQENQ